MVCTELELSATLSNIVITLSFICLLATFGSTVADSTPRSHDGCYLLAVFFILFTYPTAAIILLEQTGSAAEYRCRV